MQELYAVLLTLALFLAVILSLTAEKRTRNRITGIAAAAAALIGIIMYGSGYSYATGFGPVALMRALLAICRMFGGVNDFSSISAAPWFQNTAVVTVFWAGHVMAFYATASAAVATLGGKLLVKIRTTLLKRGELLVIFGITPESLDYARSCMMKKRYSLLFVNDACDDASETAIRSMGGVAEVDSSALQPGSRFLRHIGMKPGIRKLHIAAMHEDGLRNLAWAQQLQTALTEAGIHSEQTSLLLRGVDERQTGVLTASGGFGSVYAFDPYTLAARQLIRTLPPCQVISFDKDGRAKQDFSAVIIGFGRTGRAVLQQLVMNGQFVGSHFRADIFDEHPQKGSLTDNELLKHNVTFHLFGGKSGELYEFLKSNDTRYIVICTGNEMLNREIAQELTGWYGGLEQMPAIVQLGKSGLLCSRPGDTNLTWQGLYSADNLDIENADRLAMIINQQYCAGNGKTAVENWKVCDYFSRISSRASADFAPAFLRMSGCESWHDLTLSATQTEILSQTEHMRWCAFHEVMGWHLMPEKIWKNRAKAYAEGDHSIQIGKDSEKRLHACLIPWEDLDALSEKENAVTGGHVNYKNMDRGNVMALGELLKCAEE